MELSKRLGLKPRTSALIVNSPPGYLDELKPLPVGVEIRTEPRGRYGFIHFLAAKKEEMDQFAGVVATHGSTNTKIWLSYPLRAHLLAAHFRSEPFTRKLKEHGLAVSRHLPMDDRWVAFRLRLEKKKPIKAVAPTSGTAPRDPAGQPKVDVARTAWITADVGQEKCPLSIDPPPRFASVAMICDRTKSRSC